MNSLDNDSRTTPLRYKHRSPVINFFSKNRKTLLSKSNNGLSANLMTHGYHSKKLKETNSFDVFPVVTTPPAKRFSKIVNPFEAALTDRLHLPLIESSPTLFQRPSTPQHSSTQFTWTIDDVSSLQPANVEPYETQFQDSPDPELEAKAQSAISSYFKEQQIVPSPIDCSLRNQRIILSETNTPICKPGRRIRNNATQTVLSLPHTLPKDLEDALAPYFTFNECQQSTSNFADSYISAIEHDLRDASLRRKLFDHQGVSCMGDETFGDAESGLLTVASPPPQSPELVKSKISIPDEAFFKSRLSGPLDKSSFGSLSPIAQNSSSTNSERNSCTINCKSGGVSSVSPPLNRLYNSYRLPKVDDYASPLYKKSPMCRFVTPERSSLTQRSSSPYRAVKEMSSDCVCNIQISGLLVDTAKRSRTSAEFDLFADDTQDVEEDEMQVSQLSAISNISSESDTPRCKRRLASRKNLSQSFSNQYASNNDENASDYEQDGFNDGNKIYVPIQNSCNVDTKTTAKISNNSVLYRTDSGFNEMTTSSSQFDIKPRFMLTGEEETANTNALNVSRGDADVSMICCSTPSKHTVISL